ncbi:MAG: UDPGP type 1 family protein [Planctomycetaceae bacterium]
MNKQELLEKLATHGQEHLLAFWDELSPTEQEQLIREIRSIDFALVSELITSRAAKRDAAEGRPGERAEPPQELVRQSQFQDEAFVESAAAIGNELLKAGKVAAILVAGGQGSRLGFDAPKGMFPIGPVSERPLFQILCEQVLARSRQAGCAIPYLIMTSAATHEPTVEFFQQNKFFGLPEEDVFFFQQASLPAVDDSSHRILHAEKGRINLSPDGHGGILRAMKNSGLLAKMNERGIEHFYYHQVDNPTAIVLDPVFLGLHAQQNSDMSTKVVAKVAPEEKMGVVATLDGKTQIIEYSDLSPEEAHRKDDDGNYVFWAGNTAIHAFRTDFLMRLTEGNCGLPFHTAHKPVGYLTAEGEIVEADPKSPNAHKFEQFIFDALPEAKVALVVEADRAREFNPVKNAEGADSPETCRAALRRIAAEWVTAAGCIMGQEATIEISPLFAASAEECQQKFEAGTVLQGATVFEEFPDP